MIFAVLLCITTFLWNWEETVGHGRLIEPAARASLWRFPEYADHNPPVNWDDNELYCGTRSKVFLKPHLTDLIFVCAAAGFGVQYMQNGGKCGK